MARQGKAMKQPKYSMSRYVLTGAGLGLYFGLFFQPVREPSLTTALTLGAGAALLLTLLNLRRPEGRALGSALRYGLGAWVALTLTLLVLEGRHSFYAAAGKVGVTLFTTAAGAVAGYLYGWRSERAQ
jgi:hypothetical protein